MVSKMGEIERLQVLKQKVSITIENKELSNKVAELFDSAIKECEEYWITTTKEEQAEYALINQLILEHGFRNKGDKHSK